MGKNYCDRWEVINSLDEGGQGMIFLVNDKKSPLERRFVLKRLKNLSRMDRFADEIEAARQLDHPNIIHIFDYSLEGNSPYMVTEYCEGGSLEKSTPFWREDPLIALTLFEKICRAIYFAHTRPKSIVHRDIKPANIFLKGPTLEPVVGDFGICYIEGGTRVTLVQEAAGSQYYMAPELEDGRADLVTPKADVYSLGKLLYWMLSPNGNIFSREKHREPEWDLRVKSIDGPLGLGWKNIYMEHINRLLDFMIVDDLNERRGLENSIILLQHTKRLIEKEFTPITNDAGLPCSFCGMGRYAKKVNQPGQVRNFGFNQTAGAEWRILVCDNCGHVQLFRIEDASHKDRWD